MKMAVPAQEDLGSFILESVVRGHHVYKEVWTPLVGRTGFGERAWKLL